MTTTAIDFDTEYPITDEQVAAYQRDGCILLKGVFTPEELAAVEPMISDLVQTAEMAKIPPDQREGHYSAFIQKMNLWVESPALRPFIFGKRLARIAQRLMSTAGVRMYHDQALYKDPKGGRTPWHTDQSYWPMLGNLTTTAWIPLVDVPHNMGPLNFAKGTHLIDTSTVDLTIDDKNEAQLAKAVNDNQYEQTDNVFQLGDVSFHYGYTWHRTGANETDRMRKVMTMIYMDSQARMDPAKVDYNDAKCWCPGIGANELIASPLNPVLIGE